MSEHTNETGASDVFAGWWPAGDAEVARLTRPEREARVNRLVSESRDMLTDAIERHVWRDGRMVAATVVLFSGGNDSTVLAHLFRDEAHYAERGEGR